MGEAEASQLEHIAEMPQGCGYRLIGNPIPIKIEQVGGQYVAEADLEVMLVTNAWGSTPEEARDELAGYLAAELKRLKSANQKFLSEFEAAAQARLKEFLAETVEYGETEETFEHPEDETPPPYGMDETKLSYEAGRFSVSYALSLVEILRTGDHPITLTPKRRIALPSPRMIIVPGEPSRDYKGPQTITIAKR